jgi:class 3 adenylate cyclase
MEVVSMNEETGEFEIILRPNPERYEWRQVDGERALYDKLDNTIMPESVLAESLKFAQGTPMYYQPPRIDNARDYIKSRIPTIAAMLDGEMPPATFEDKSEAFLQSLSQNRLGFVIMSLDMVGSTQLASATEPEVYAQLVVSLLYELSEVIPKFHGHVLKYTGDGFIAYFPEPSFITKNDLAIDCALMLRALVYEAFNPLLEQRSLPAVGIRIGMEAGEAYVVTMGSPETKQHKDIIGAVISLAAKIEKQADPGGIYFGNTMEQNLHTSLRAICEPAPLGENWKYMDGEGNPYRVHRVRVS